MRALLRPLSTHTVYSPIETVVFVFVLATFAYFQILAGIKHSSFFAPSFLTKIRPAYARYSSNEWLGIGKGDWIDWKHSEGHVKALELQPVIFALKDDSIKNTQDLGLNHSALSDIATYITTQPSSLTGRIYGSLCHISPNGCFTASSSSATSTTLTLSFKPGGRDEWLDTVRNEKSVVVNGLKYEVDPDKTQESIGEMKSSKWVAYALRALVIRFWELAKKADSLDILVVLVGYILMHSTFLRLFFSSRALGSNLWLSTGIFSSSVTAFLLTLPLCRYLSIPLDPISLTEALPFLVCTVGFDKPLRLAKAVMAHPHALRTQADGRMKPAGEVVLEALDRVGNVILRDYALEVAVLLVGVNSKVGGLKEFCSVAAVAMIMDCVMLATYYTSVLTIMVEVRRIKLVRNMSRSRATTPATVTANGTALRPALSRSMTTTVDVPVQKNLRERISDAVLGVKGSLLRDANAPEDKAHVVEENPMARLKLLLIASFLTLHILNFCTTLTPSTGLHTKNILHRPGVEVAVVHAPRVDITSPAISSVLAELAASERTQLSVPSAAASAIDEELVVKVASPIYIKVSPTPSSDKNTSEALENFMSSWSRLVGDPVFSKWIVGLLAVSIALNGYLLKGIAAGSGLAALKAVRKHGVRFRSRVRRDGDESATEAEHAASPPITIMPAVVPPPARVVPAPAPPPAPEPVRDPLTPSGVQSVLDLDKVDLRLREKALRVITTVPAESLTPSGESDTTFVDHAEEKEPETKIGPVRTLEECIDVFENGPRPVSVSLAMLNDEEVILLAQNGKIAPYALEKVLGDFDRAVFVRRALISRASRTKTLEHSDVPMLHYDYSRVMGACCENVIGYMPIPLGVAGPLTVDGQSYHIPMATAEGTLVASTSRGCKALNAGGGVTTVLTHDAMTRGPAIDFLSITSAAAAKAWIESEDGYAIIKEAFESTSRFAKLQNIKCAMAGRTLFVRFATRTGDAMGMNMISKATEKALEVLGNVFPEMVVLALSGNYCTDKKPAAINWIEGRGKSVVAEAVIPGKIVKSVLKTTVAALCNLNTKKNLVGSAMAGSVGGFNAHAANILTAMFLATGQDPAQNVESSNCMTLMEPTNNGEDLLMTVSMPCIEVGTIGGGTVLAPQQAVLDMLGVRGAHPTNPGQNAQQLARIIASAVMAGELSLISALAAGHLIRAHMAHNRSQLNTPNPSRPMTPALSSPAGGVFWADNSKGTMSSIARPSSAVSGYSVEMKSL